MASLYVGNIPWSSTQEELDEVFTGFNYTSIEIVYDQNGRSRGYALANFDSKEDADSCLANIPENIEVGGRTIYVREDRRGQNQGGGGGGQRNSRPQRRQYNESGDGEYVADNTDYQESTEFTGTSVYVGNLSWNIDWEQLKEAFADYNPEFAMVKTDRFSGRSRGWGTVKFADEDTANKAIEEMNGVEIDGRPVNLRVDRKG